MSKRSNSVIFILCGTLVNVALSLTFIVALVALSLRFRDALGDALPVALGASLFLGVILAMFAYQKIAGWVIARFGLEDKLGPLFNRRPRRK